MGRYEPPRIEFKQLTFFERIANSCWSASSAFFDMNWNGKSDSCEGLSLYSSDCQANNDYILRQMRNKLGFFYEMWYYSSGAYRCNVLSNTGAAGIKCVFSSGGIKPPCPTHPPKPPKWPHC